MIGLITAAAMTFLLALTLVRLLAAPTLYDRALVAGSAAVKAAVACAAIGVAAQQTLVIDVAFALGLGALVLNVAVLKFFRSRTFQAPLARQDG